MKYMGHKGKLLPVLGDVLLEESKSSRAVADPFCGSGAVSWFLSQHSDKQVVSGDLQSFAVHRAAAVVERTARLDGDGLCDQWFSRAEAIVSGIVNKFPNAQGSIEPVQTDAAGVIDLVQRSRVFCEEVMPDLAIRRQQPLPMTMAYGGHYFSPMQAIWMDALRATLPQVAEQRAVAMAALIETASRCAASPGHTAQPFQPTESSAKHILSAWRRSVPVTTRDVVRSLADKFAQRLGRARVLGFSETISSLDRGDLVFADPPYSDVHYSRFYHVLETLARGKEIQVTGRGRYPDISERPSSEFSMKMTSLDAARALVHGCHERGLGLVLTFPSGQASNGLSAETFMELSEGLFASIEELKIDSDFSTLGGNAKIRSARLQCQESIICFRH